MLSKNKTDTIAAIATAPGRGGVGILRVSGELAHQIAQKILKKIPQKGEYLYGDFLSAEGSAIDQGISLWFESPNSFTGEDVLELQGHGGPVVMGMLLDQVVSYGARIAKPGEFTERAFLNNKLDLAEAEAVADLINAQSQAAAKSAFKSLQGAFSKEINLLVERLIQLRLYVEAAIDFPEEEIDFLTDSHVLKDAEKLLEDLELLLNQAKKGELLQTGINLVIAGRPNAGKSSLLNALSGKDSAIVTDIPGTTRDVLKESIAIEGIPLHIFDTAGIRITQDLIEQEGVKRAFKAIQESDRVLLLIDQSDLVKLGEIQEIKDEILEFKPTAISYVINKMDCLSDSEKLNLKTQYPDFIFISAKTGEGMEDLKKHLLACVGLDQVQENLFSARKRHLVALEEAIGYLKQAITQLKHHQAGELFAEDCRLAQEALNQITGEFTSDDLLGRIFSSFCIGK